MKKHVLQMETNHKSALTEANALLETSKQDYSVKLASLEKEQLDLKV